MFKKAKIWDYGYKKIVQMCKEVIHSIPGLWKKVQYFFFSFKFLICWFYKKNVKSKAPFSCLEYTTYLKINDSAKF